MYNYVIFDLDGTLLDTLEDLADATNWVLQLHNWPTRELEQYKQFVGNGAGKLLERAVPGDLELTPELRKQLMDEFLQRYDAHKEDKTTAYAGMPALLSRLKEAGIVTAVLSNKPHAAAGPIVERYYPGLLSAVQGAMPDAPTKPDPTLLHRLMEHLGASTENTLFVGDSDVDICTAKNGQMTSCGVLWGFRTRQELEAEGADLIAATAEELEHYIFK